MTDDDDVREMLRSKAAEVGASDDGWEKISARLQEAPARPVGRRLALAGAAAAVIAGTVFVANVNPTTQVAKPEPTTSTTVVDGTVPVEELPAHVFASPSGFSWDAERTALQYILDRTGVVPSDGEVINRSDAGATVLFREGPVVSEVTLRQLGENRYVVDSAASDLVPIHDPVYEQGVLSADLGIEAGGVVAITTGGPVEDGRSTTEERRVRRLDLVPVRASLPDERYARVAVVLRTDDGVIAVSETWVTDHTDALGDPATATGSYVAIWPAVDSVGLATLQDDADAGRRPDLLDPQAVAGSFLAELLPRNESPTTYAVSEFQQGDNTSGEVPYTLSDGASGTILVRTTGGDGAIWHVTGATSDDLELLTPHREETHLIADVRSDATGTLTWTGATPVEVRSGQKVSIGRPDTPLGNHPIVIRLMDGGRTLAIVAGLG